MLCHIFAGSGGYDVDIVGTGREPSPLPRARSAHSTAACARRQSLRTHCAVSAGPRLQCQCSAWRTFSKTVALSLKAPPQTAPHATGLSFWSHIQGVKQPHHQPESGLLPQSALRPWDTGAPQGHSPRAPTSHSHPRCDPVAGLQHHSRLISCGPSCCLGAWSSEFQL